MSALRRGGAIAAAAAGLLALTLVPSGAAQAAPASVAAACKATGYSPTKVVMGSATVKKTFAVKTANCAVINWGITVYPYTQTSKLGTAFVMNAFSPTASFNPKTFTNADAGKHIAWVYAAENGSNSPQVSFPFTVARAATFGKTLNATPEPVKKGKKITVKATLKRISWTYKSAKKMPYGSYSGQPVALQFEAKGAKTFKTVKTVKTTSGGKFSTTVTASKSGTWRVSFAGNSTTGAAVSTGDAVIVK